MSIVVVVYIFSWLIFRTPDFYAIPKAEEVVLEIKKYGFKKYINQTST